MEKRNYSMGWGDGNKAEITSDIFEVRVSHNTTHKHLPGDFVERKVGGEFILMKRDKFDRLQEAATWLRNYWASCNPNQKDLDDYQISEITKRMVLFKRMLGVEDEKNPKQ